MNSNPSDRNPIFGRAPTVAFVVLIVVVSGLLVDTIRADSDNFYSDIMRFDQVATKVHQNYVEEVNTKDLVDKAINGMLGILDPHTNYFEEKQFDELRIHTEGKFGGLGIQISIRENVLTVITPIAGTPASRAGIQSGDQIWEIDGKATKGTKLDDAVAKLRGEPGTKVTILVRRKGEDKPIPYTLTREVIRIMSVPYSGVFSDSIGYVRLTQFSQETGEELEKAIKSLLQKNIKSLILDLRLNPGGLLPQAIEVASKFLPRKSLVVYTIGRAPGQSKQFEAESNPIVPGSMPVAVLVNAGSASASEIVAGAIQDWDRGLIIGDTTFGKGSVQSIFELDKTHHLKMTTAFYYTPSGRCINKPENDIRGVEDDESEDGDQPADSTGPVQQKLQVGPGGNTLREQTAPKKLPRDTAHYATKNKRIVHGGGGIIPDTVILPPMPDQLVRALFRSDVFFRFANAEYPRLHNRNAKIDTKMTIDDAIMKDFRIFLDTTKFQFKTYATSTFDDFKSRVGLKDSSDTTKKNDDDAPKLSADETKALKSAAEQIEKVLSKQNDHEFTDRDAEIRKYIKEALLMRELGQDNEVIYRMTLLDDVQFKTAVDLLMNKSKYSLLLQPRTAGR